MRAMLLNWFQKQVATIYLPHKFSLIYNTDFVVVVVVKKNKTLP
jgi:hypothetical protein